jgi:hypothetical protein
MSIILSKGIFKILFQVLLNLLALSTLVLHSIITFVQQENDDEEGRGRGEKEGQKEGTRLGQLMMTQSDVCLCCRVLTSCTELGSWQAFEILIYPVQY